MTNPAVKTRKEVSKDLVVANFGEKQSLAIVQAVVDTTATLDLVTRTDLDQAVEALDQKIEALRRDLQDLSRRTDARFEALDQKIEALRRDLSQYIDDQLVELKRDLSKNTDEKFNVLDQRIGEVKQEIDNLRSLIYRGFIVGLGILSLLVVVFS